MGPILAIVAVGAVLAVAFSSSRNAPRTAELARVDRLDERKPGRTVLAQGLHGSGR